MCFPLPGRVEGTTSLWKQELPFHVMKKLVACGADGVCNRVGKEVPRDCGFKVQFQKECKPTSGFRLFGILKKERTLIGLAFFL